MGSALGKSNQLQSVQTRQPAIPKLSEPDIGEIAVERLNKLEADMSSARSEEEKLESAKTKTARSTVFSQVMLAGAFVLAVSVILLPPPVSWPTALPQPFRAIALIVLAVTALGELLYGGMMLVSARNSSRVGS